MLDRVIKVLKTVFDYEDEVYGWLKLPNPAWTGFTARDLIRVGAGETVLDYIRCRFKDEIRENRCREEIIGSFWS